MAAVWDDGRAARVLRAMFDAAVRSADPMAVLARHLPAPPTRGRVLVLGVGKAAARMARAVEAALRPVPMNIDGATAVIYAELGFAAPLARGLFVLSRSVGILAHAWEESQQGRRNKGPMPPSILPAYLGHDQACEG